MMYKKISALLFFIFAFASCAFGASALDKDTLIAGTESTYPPYESRNAKGELEGFDIELAETIAAKLGKKLQWIDMPFDSLIPSLMSGKIDLVAAGINKTHVATVTLEIPVKCEPGSDRIRIRIIMALNRDVAKLRQIRQFHVENCSLPPK